MKTLKPWLLVLVTLFLLPISVYSQDITIRAVDGSNGNPITGEHLLVFAGSNEEDLKSHAISFEAKTDEAGVAILHLGKEQISLIQVWVDFHTQCVAHPNAVSYSVAEIGRSGVSGINTCGRVRIGPSQNTLIIYARTSHLLEKMRR